MKHAIGGTRFQRVTLGQVRAWKIRSAQRENARRMRSHHWHHRDAVEMYEPYGDPGPGKVALVEKFSVRGNTCTYRWTKRAEAYRLRNTGIPCLLKVPTRLLLNADAYTPGDFRIFFDDPRTRADYLKWAPLLLECEEYHAGNREVKPLKNRKDR